MVATLARLTPKHAKYYQGGTNIIEEPEHEQVKPMARFMGLGADYLGIEGDRIEKDDPRLEHLFNGRSPDGAYQFRAMQDRERINPDTGEREVLKARAGYDHTLNAPKSFSLAYAFGSEEQRAELLRCHQKATESVIDYLTQNSFIRTGAGGKNQEQVKPVFVVVDHDTNRANEPHLHAHVVQMNYGLRENGKWGAIDANHQFHEHHKIGGIYLGSLEHEFRSKFNEQTRIVELANGRSFEIQVVSQELTNGFSSRSKQAREHLEAKEIPETGKALRIATLDTRETKHLNVDRGQIQSEWLDRAHALGGAPEQLQLKEPAKELQNSQQPEQTQGRRGHLVDVSPTRYKIEAPEFSRWDHLQAQVAIARNQYSALHQDYVVGAKDNYHPEKGLSFERERFWVDQKLRDDYRKRVIQDSIGSALGYEDGERLRELGRHANDAYLKWREIQNKAQSSPVGYVSGTVSGFQRVANEAKDKYIYSSKPDVQRVRDRRDGLILNARSAMIDAKAREDIAQGKKPRQTMAGDEGIIERTVRSSEAGNKIADAGLKLKYGNTKNVYKSNTTVRDRVGFGDKEKVVARLEGSNIQRAVTADKVEYRPVGDTGETQPVYKDRWFSKKR